MQACICALTLGQAVSVLTASDTSEAADSESTAAAVDSPSAAAAADSSPEEKTSAAATGADSPTTMSEEKTSVTMPEVIDDAGRTSFGTCCFDWCIHTFPVIPLPLV